VDGLDLCVARQGDLLRGLTGAVERPADLLADEREVADAASRVVKLRGEAVAGTRDPAAGLGEGQGRVAHPQAGEDLQAHPGHQQQVTEDLERASGGKVGVDLHAGLVPVSREVTASRVPRSLPPGGYFSSAELLPSSRRATMSCWICWVPSKMSRIFESRAHFSSSSCSL
jgi:hypothetical protein